MAIAAVNEIWSGRMGGIDGKYVRRYMRIWRVISTEREDGPLEITATTSLPTLYSTYVNITGTETDVGATLRSLDARQDTENPFLWEVIGEYSSDDIPIPARESPVARAGTGTSKGDSVEASPLDLIPDIAFGVQKFQKPASINYVSGTDTVRQDPIRNSAGMLFDPPPQIDASRFTLTITRHEAVFPTATAIDYTDTLNGASWRVMGYTFPALCVKCDGITGSSMFHQNLFFWKVTYLYMIRPPFPHPETGASVPGWDEVPLDAGHYENNGTKFIEIVEKYGHTMSGASPLDGLGRALTAAAAAAGTFSYVGPFQTYRAKNFDFFGFPQEFP